MGVPKERLDMIVMGATGFQGRYTVKTLLNFIDERQFTWGIAGRNYNKLQNLLQKFSREGFDTTQIPVIVANINDENSLIKMTSQTKVVINCCGPYRFLGEPVIKACLQTKTHHLDVSGEPQYMESMQLYYHDKASEQGVYVISACGMSGVPADVGVAIFEKLFDGTVNDIEIHIELELAGKIGHPIHYGTWASLIHSLTHVHELRELRKQVFSKKCPPLTPKIKKRGMMHKSKITNQWCLTFAGADRSVVYRSQQFKYAERQQRPIQTQVFISASANLFVTLFVVFVSTVIGIMAVFGNSFTRKLLLKFPKFFSAGLVSHEGPTEQQMNNVIEHVTFSGSGWSEKNNGLNITRETNKSMKMKFSARNPGYGFTSYAIILAALTILYESESMPGKGGVYPPGYAFAETTFHKQLCDKGVEIKVIGCTHDKTQ